MVGNFLADFIQSREAKNFPQGIRNGILLHRKIDSFTDNHPLIRQGTQRLRPHFRKYAGVVLDVFLDFLLARQWNTFSREPFPDFRQRVYAVLQRYQSLMPAPVQQRLPSMISGDWLAQYGTWDGLAYALSRLQRRTSQPRQLDHATRHLQTHLPAFEEEFLQFFPQIMEFVQGECSELCP